ncbi:MAG: hypothetical protein CMO30_02220 [Tistrella sp.]|nr:hypothetical protein [Tistrella sp.]MBB03887.1 hypothetical protein [Planctomyces sp.]
MPDTKQPRRANACPGTRARDRRPGGASQRSSRRTASARRPPRDRGSGLPRTGRRRSPRAGRTRLGERGTPPQRSSWPSTTAAESGAKAVGKEGLFGSLEVGKSADFIVLDRNLFDVDPQEIDGAVVLQTIFEGVTVYRDERAR